MEAVNYEELIEGKRENDEVYDEETTIGDEYDGGVNSTSGKILCLVAFSKYFVHIYLVRIKQSILLL